MNKLGGVVPLNARSPSRISQKLDLLNARASSQRAKPKSRGAKTFQLNSVKESVVEAEGYSVDCGTTHEPVNQVSAGCVALLRENHNWQCVDIVLVKRSICALLNLFHWWPWVSSPEELPCRAKIAVLPCVTLNVLMSACMSEHCPGGLGQRKILEPDGPP